MSEHRPGAGRDDRTARFILDRAWDRPRIDGPRLIYLIASEPRTGSNLLCGLLSQSGVAGVPLEYFHPEASQAAMARHGLADFDAYLRDLLLRRCTPNGVFGVKVHFHQFAHFTQAAKAGLPRPPRVLRITRRDLAAQTVSLYLALATGRWSHHDAPGPAPELRYDFRRLTHALSLLRTERENWATLFRQNGIAPPVIDYESLAADPAAGLAAALRHLGIAADPAAPPPEPPATRQGNARNTEWAARFRADALKAGLDIEAA